MQNLGQNCLVAATYQWPILIKLCSTSLSCQVSPHIVPIFAPQIPRSFQTESGLTTKASRTITPRSSHSIRWPQLRPTLRTLRISIFDQHLSRSRAISDGYTRLSRLAQRSHLPSRIQLAAFPTLQTWLYELWPTASGRTDDHCAERSRASKSKVQRNLSSTGPTLCRGQQCPPWQLLISSHMRGR